MADWKKLPVKAELAIAQGVREVVDIVKGDKAAELVIDAVLQAIMVNLYGADFAPREGFKFVALGKVDLSGVDKLAALKAAVAVKVVA